MSPCLTQCRDNCPLQLLHKCVSAEPRCPDVDDGVGHHLTWAVERDLPTPRGSEHRSTQ